MKKGTKRADPAQKKLETMSWCTSQEPDEDSALSCALASEAVLARDWLTPEEDEAWSSL